ncbi:MAG TPA: BamA/TamA family outer membrane protein [Kofleriaceae bacterium]|nr:BamA/TamA family outer membrane protein [Kofleriaceae bacterium]
MWVAALVLGAALDTAAADPVASSSEPRRRPTEPTVPAPSPVRHEPTAAGVAGDPPPGEESGRRDEIDPGDSAGRQIARGVLWLPKVLFELAMAPIHAAVWAEDRYQLTHLYVRTFFNKDQSIGLYPTASYETAVSADVGARFIHKNLFGSHELLSLHARTGALFGDGYREAALGTFRTGDLLHRVQLGIDASYDRRPADPFYGIGNGDLAPSPEAPIDPRRDDRAIETYHRYRELRLAILGEVHATDELRVRTSGSVTDLRFARSDSGAPIDSVYDSAGLVGFDTGVRHAYGELEVRWDSRRRISRWEPPDLHAGGSLISAFAGRDHRLTGDGIEFWRYGLDLQHFWRIARGPRVVVARVHGEGITGERDEIPFTQLPTLGGALYLRGYPSGRFRDRVAGFGTLQYEWDVSHFIDAYVFTDVGRVFPSLEDVTWSGLRAGYGIGLELHSDRGFLLEGSLASSIDGGVVVSLSLNPVLDTRPRWR